jgi:hypothetical protein
MIRTAISAVLRRVADWLAKPAPPKKAAAEAPAVSTDTHVKRLREGMQGIREHLRRMGAALGAAATAVLAGLGYTQVHQLFPLPENLGSSNVKVGLGLVSLDLTLSGKQVLLILAGFGVVAAPLGAAWLAGRFFGAQRRILITTKPEEWGGDLADVEKTLAAGVLEEHARSDDAESLFALELRGERHRRIANRLADAEKRKAHEQEADRIESVLETAIVESAATILERRAEKAVHGWATRGALALAVAGAAALFAAADYSKGQRDLVDLRVKCADGISKGAPDACDPVRSADQRRAIALGRAVVEATKQKDRQAAAAEAKALPAGAAGLYAKVVACMKSLSADKDFTSASESVKSAAISACAQLSG